MAWGKEQGARSMEQGAGSREQGAGSMEYGVWSKEPVNIVIIDIEATNGKLS